MCSHPHREKNNNNKKPNPPPKKTANPPKKTPTENNSEWGVKGRKKMRADEQGNGLNK